jgi:hypothetical protein
MVIICSQFLEMKLNDLHCSKQREFDPIYVSGPIISSAAFEREL